MPFFSKREVIETEQNGIADEVETHSRQKETWNNSQDRRQIITAITWSCVRTSSEGEH